jgi:pyridinium-3,5-biscarboxylic acid mononucleotide sulfurtransferase
VGDTAKIEVPIDLIPNFINTIDLLQLTSSFKAFGFLTITLDLEGFRSGKLNDLIA